MLAIPVLRARVAPVLDWCSSIHLYPADPDYHGAAQEVDVSHLEVWERLELLHERGVQVLICGALSPELRHYVKKLGITLVCGVAGGIEEVRRSYWRNQLDQPEFWLPGCRGPRRYRSGFRGGRDCPGQGSRQARTTASPARPTVTQTCRCPACDLSFPHKRGIPCRQIACPRCGRPLVRE